MKKILMPILISLSGAAFAQNPPVRAVLTEPNSSRDAPNQGSMDLFKLKNQQYIEKMNQVCGNELYKPFFAKTPCIEQQITFEELADKSKATEAEKKTIPLIDKEYQEATLLRADNYKNNIKPALLGIKLSDLKIQFRAEEQDNLMKLYDGKITWGQFNTKRKALATASKEAFDKAVKDSAPK
jgi:hypothetical protein